MVSQWRSSVNLHNCNTLEHHWKTIGSTLETHWLPAILTPVAFQCTLGSRFLAHWIATGLPLDYHWLRVGAILICWNGNHMNISHIQVSGIYNASQDVSRLSLCCASSWTGDDEVASIHWYNQYIISLTLWQYGYPALTKRNNRMWDNKSRDSTKHEKSNPQKQDHLPIWCYTTDLIIQVG